MRTWKAAIEALQGTVVSIVNDQAVTYTLCLIAQVDGWQNQPALHAGGERGELRISGVVT